MRDHVHGSTPSAASTMGSKLTAPGDGEVTVVADESMGEKDPLLAKLLASATAGAEPAGRRPSRISQPLWAA